MLKLAKSVKSLRVLLTTIMECMNNVSYMTLLLFLFVYMFAILGMQGTHWRVASSVVVSNVLTYPWLFERAAVLAVFPNVYTKNIGLTLASNVYNFGT